MKASQLFRVFVLSIVIFVFANGPLMAMVTFGLVYNTDGTVTITMDTGGDVVRGVAIRVICTGGAQLLDYSFTANPEFNTFIDWFAQNGVGPVVGDTPAQEGYPFVGNIGDTDFIISMGVLDENENQAGYNGAGDLITFNIGAGDVCIELDTIRGGVVGDVELTSNLDDGAQICSTPIFECLKYTASFYTDWVEWNKPDCWCYQKHCRGDADGDGELGGAVQVFSEDLAIFISAYGQPSGALDISKICADFNHAPELGGAVRVFSEDLAVLVQYYAQPAASVPDCDSSNYNFWIDPDGSYIPF